VGPVWREDKDKDLLKKQLESCVVNILEMATIIGAKSVSIPAISTGYFGFPRELCA
jgi:O-acetyl-ADP-ribose deacetylase (regulator of RNase III)